MTGRVKWWSDQMGYGFIQVTGQPNIFVHFSGIADKPGVKYKSLEEGQEVVFMTEFDAQGRPFAVNVETVEDLKDGI